MTNLQRLEKEVARTQAKYEAAFKRTLKIKFGMGHINVAALHKAEVAVEAAHEAWNQAKLAVFEAARMEVK